MRLTRPARSPTTVSQGRRGDEMDVGEIFQNIERLMMLLEPECGTDRLKLIAYQAMVKAVRIFKAIIKGQDFKETED